MTDYFEKQTSEEFNISVSFERNLEETEILTLADVKAYFNSKDVTDEIIEETMIENNLVYIRIKGGKIGRKYKITIIVNTSDENTYEHDVFLKVKEV